MIPAACDQVVKGETEAGSTGYVADTKPESQIYDIMATLHDEDERLLARIGYKQVLRREFDRWSTISYAISILGVLGSQPATYGVPISIGGPATAVWAWFVGSIMAMVIACSVAELVSAYPTAGGMYFVTKHVVPKEHVALWSWTIGWCNFLGQSCGVASIAYTLGQMILALRSKYSDYNQPEHIVAIAIAFLIIFGLICSLTTRALHRLIRWFAPIQIAATFIVGISVVILTPDKRDPKFVFTDVRSGTGWPRGFSFLLGFLNVAWVMTDYDGTTHMSEETHDSAIAGPRAIWLSVFTSGILGWFLNICFTFCLPESYVEDIVGSPTGLPIAEVFFRAGGIRGGTAMLFAVILVQFFTGASAMLANSRMAYAFARDEALPFSAYWSKINHWTGTPVNAVWLVFSVCVCLNLIGMGSTETITAVFNLCAPCLDISYIAVLFARLWYQSDGRVQQFVAGPFSLGKYGKPLNILAIAWVCFISVVLFFPTTRPLTAKNMNYASVVAVAVAAFSFGWWWLGGARHRYHGPKDEVGMHSVPSFVYDEVDSPPDYQPDYGTNKPAALPTSGI